MGVLMNDLHWLEWTKIVPAIITLILIYLMWKYLKEAIRDDKEGKKSGKCDLD